MSTVDLDNLLDRWEDAQKRGTPVSVEELCRDAPELLAEVRRHVAALESFDGMADTCDANAAASSNPETILVGPRYVPIRLHAKGGLGEVYLANDRRLDRPVALKQIQSRHAGNTGLRERFGREAAITARLQHPGIVPIYDVSENAAGQPTYAMRFVEGQSLEEALAKPPPPQRSNPEFRALLNRFIAACNAIAYAHDHGVIHRDIKPANILLGAYGETLVVDWGLAKIVASGQLSVVRQTDGSHEPLDAESNRAGYGTPIIGTPTVAGEVFGTPLYMSPEQASAKEVGPACDIYSLGATLYHMLTGRASIDEAKWPVMRRQIISGDFAPPRKLNPRIPPALEAVCQKAMALDSAKRYGSVLQFAGDLEHWLADEPVIARREPWIARLKRWIRHHATLVTAGAATFAVGICSLAVATVLLLAANEREHTARVDEHAARQSSEAARDRAETERAANTAVRRFLQHGLLRQADNREQAELLRQIGRPASDVVANPTVKDLLDRAAAALDKREIEKQFPNQPLVQAEILTTVGDTYRSIGEPLKAIPFLQRAVELRQNALGPDHAETLSSANDLGLAYWAADQFSRSIALLEQVAGDRSRTLGPDHMETLTARHNLGLAYLYAHEPAKAVALLEQVRDDRTRTLGKDHDHTMTARNNLAAAYVNANRFADAAALLEELRDERTKMLGAEHKDTLTSAHNLAVAYRGLGRLDESIALGQSVYEVRRRLFGADDFDTLATLHILAQAHQAAGRWDQAIQLAREVRDVWIRLKGPEYLETLRATHSLACIYDDANRLDDAIDRFRQALEGRTKTLGAEHRDTLTTMNHLGETYRKAGRLDEAAAVSQQLRDVVVRAQGLANPDSQSLQRNLALIYLRMKRYDAAEKLFSELHAIQLEKQPEDWTTFHTKSVLGQSLFGLTKFDEAKPLLIGGYEGLKTRRDQIPPQFRTRIISEAGLRLVMLYDAMSRPADKARWQAEIDALSRSK